jgi:hypothetical protein
VHIFIDRDSIEVFGEMHSDGGTPRWSGLTRLWNNTKEDTKVHSIRLVTKHPEGISKIQLHPIKPIELRGRWMTQNAENSHGVIANIEGPKPHSGSGQRKKVEEKGGMPNVEKVEGPESD